MKKEQECINEGQRRHHKKISKLVAKKQESKAVYSRFAYKTYLRDFTKRIKRLIRKKTSGKASHAAVSWTAISELRPIVIAHLTLKTVLNSISTKNLRTSVAVAIGKALEDEMNFSRLKKTKKNWWKSIQKSKFKRATTKFRRSFLIKRANDDFGDQWKTDIGIINRSHIGLSLIELFRVTTGMIEYTKIRISDKRMAFAVLPTRKTLDWIQKINQKFSILQPFLYPLNEKPLDWTSLTSGGYDFPPDTNWFFIKTRKKTLKTLYSSSDFSLAFKAANVLQRVPFRVNEPVRFYLRESLTKGIKLNTNILGSLEIDLSKSFGSSERENDTMSYRRSQAKKHQRKLELLPRIMTTASIMSLARDNRNKTMYFPVQADFRGRLYYVPKYLNPQGNDLAKGLLEFSEGSLTRGNEHWFLIGGANSYGIRGSLKDREEWVLGQRKWIRAAADDPIDKRSFWLGAENPVPFLAWCFEFNKWWTNRISFKTHLPVKMDHTASGLQIIAGLTKDKNLLKYTNMTTSSDQPEDIYVILLKSIKKVLKASSRPEDHAWISYGLNRKLIKNLLVSYMYGGSFWGLEKIVLTWYLEAKEDVFERKIYLEIRNFLKLFFEQLSILTDAPMKFMEECRSEQNGELLSWTSPSGFPVVNFYNPNKSTLVRTTVDGDRICARVNVTDEDSLDPKAARKALPANKVHSYDAALLHTVLLNRDWNQILTLHDCYGVPPRDADALQAAVKKAMTTIFGLDSDGPLVYACS